MKKILIILKITTCLLIISSLMLFGYACDTESATERYQCETCRDTGKISCPNCNGSICISCFGKGYKKADENCFNCRGKGLTYSRDKNGNYQISDCIVCVTCISCKETGINRNFCGKCETKKLGVSYIDCPDCGNND